MRLAIVQTDPVFGRKKRNIDQAVSMIKSAEADLYVLPELFASGYNFASLDEVRDLAESYDKGETFVDLKKVARERQCFIVFGFAESANGAFYNSAAIVFPDGTSGLYRKIHLYDREKLFFKGGDLGFRVFDSTHGKIGIMVCYDWYFPEAARTLALMGARIIAHPSNLVLPNCPDSMPVRCRENRVFAATANRVGTEDRGGESLTYIGQSQITSPRGEILYRCSRDKAEVVVREIDLVSADNKTLNDRNHLLNDRRPEFYL